MRTVLQENIYHDIFCNWDEGFNRRGLIAIQNQDGNFKSYSNLFYPPKALRFHFSGIK